MINVPKRPKLLVVDDQPINIQVMYRAFSEDHQVFMATSGEQALAICRKNPPDLLLLDVVMPDLDGFEVCRQLKADVATRNIPIIFVTAHNAPDQETHGLEVGAVDFIAKPINPIVVRARVKTHLTLKFQSDLLHQMAFIDGLTRVCNRRYFDERLQNEWRRSSRNGSPLSLILIDIDFFKKFNDRYGHLAGDDCLRQVASALKAGLNRPGDMLARYGGEEFVCLLPETAPDGAMELATRLEHFVRELAVEHLDSELGTVTISLGVAGRPANAPGTPEGLLALADAQLYRAKKNGRACACGEILGKAVSS
ncbi:MAG: diguanylate cyclase [Acidobacteria bacterium]|nr:diguanylate cyclase [Acidobacteriota bacterium]MCB9399580.1 diguanylate cyclase [Acidobacteriota bacterium]